MHSCGPGQLLVWMHMKLFHGSKEQHLKQNLDGSSYSKIDRKKFQGELPTFHPRAWPTDRRVDRQNLILPFLPLANCPFSFLPRLPRKFHPDFRPLGWKSKLPRKSGKRTTATIRPYGSQCGESKVQWVQSNESMPKGGVPQSNKCGWDMEASSFSNLWWNVWFRAGSQGKCLTWLKWFLVLRDVMMQSICVALWWRTG